MLGKVFKNTVGIAAFGACNYSLIKGNCSMIEIFTVTTFVMINPLTAPVFLLSAYISEKNRKIYF